MTITVAIFIQNGEAWRLRNALKQYRAQTLQPDQLIVIDFGSKREYLNQYSAHFNEFDAEVVLYPGAGLFHPAKIGNIAIEEATSDFVIFSEIDALPEVTAIEKVKRAMLDNQKRLIVCGRFELNESSNNDEIDYTCNLDQMIEQNTMKFNPNAYGSFLGLPTKDAKEIKFDERYNGWGKYDDDIVLRAQNHGLELCRIDGLPYSMKLAHVWHEPREYVDQTDHDANIKQFQHAKSAILERKL